MKKASRVSNIARERIDILIDSALREARVSNGSLAQDQALLAKKIAMRYRIRLDYSVKRHYCKNCKKFIVPGLSARIRTGRSRLKAIRVTCLNCNHTYRKIIDKKPENKDL